MRMKVSGMTCGGCVASVRRAVTALDPQAEVEVDLDSGMVRVQSARTNEEIASRVRAAGFGVDEISAAA